MHFRFSFIDCLTYLLHKLDNEKLGRMTNCDLVFSFTDSLTLSWHLANIQKMRAFTIRLLPGDDLQQKLIDFVKDKNLSSGEKLEKSDKSEKYGHIMDPYRNQPPDDVVESNNNFQRSSSLALAP